MITLRLAAVFAALAAAPLGAQLVSFHEVTSPTPEGHWFGDSVAGIGDLNGDGVPDAVVGAPCTDSDVIDSGAVWIHFLAADGSVLSRQEISPSAGGFGFDLPERSYFGGAVASLGDLDGDGIVDIAVGSPVADFGAINGTGAVWILFLNADGTVRQKQKIDGTEGGFSGALEDSDGFGGSVARLPDMDGDGVPELAVGAPRDDDGTPGSCSPTLNCDKGAVWVLFLRSDGTVKSQNKISSSIHSPFSQILEKNDQFGISVTSVGDVDGNGVADLAAGAWGYDINRGAVFILYLDAHGELIDFVRITTGEGGFTEVLESSDQFGIDVASLGDLDGDGFDELAVGAFGDDDGGSNLGAVWLLSLEAGGTVKEHLKLSGSIASLASELESSNRFGTSVGSLGDLDGDGLNDLIVGESVNFTGTPDGRAWLFTDLCLLEAVQQSVTIRNGTTANPELFVPTAGGSAIIGETFTPLILSGLMTGADAKFVIISHDPAEVPTPFGTLLCSLPTPFSFAVEADVISPFSFPIPVNCGLIGDQFCFQGGLIKLGPPVQAALANALDVTLGTF